MKYENFKEDYPIIYRLGLQMAEYTKRFITRIAGVTEGGICEHRGSGILCELKERQAIVTAAHVFRDMATAGRFRSVAFSRGDGLSPRACRGTIYYADPIDLAIYLPDEGFPVGEDKVYWSQQRIRNFSPPFNDYFVAHGYPGRFSRTTSFGGLTYTSEIYLHCSMKRFTHLDIERIGWPDFDREYPNYPYLPDDFLKEYEFALNFAADTGPFSNNEGDIQTRQSVIDDWNLLYEDGTALPGQRMSGAFGLSGSPVWRFGIPDSSIETWTPERCELVGIVTQWNETHHALVVTESPKLLVFSDSLLGA